MGKYFRGGKLISADTVRILGNRTIASGDEEGIWPGSGGRGIPTGAAQVEVVSSSANDDGDPVGTGVRTVRLDYIDANGVRQSENFTLNGTTAVNSVATNILFVLGLSTLTVGSGLGAAGTISVRSVGGATTYEVIAAGQNQSASAYYRVPAGHQLWVTRLQASTGTSTVARVRLLATANPFTGAQVNAFFCWADQYALQSGNAVQPDYPIGPFPAATVLNLTGTGNTAQVAVELVGYLEAV